MSMRWEFVPMIGLVVAFVRHWKATREHYRNPTWDLYGATWAALDNYHIALATTVIPLLFGVVLFALFSR